MFKSHTGAEDAILLAEARREIGLSMSLETNAIKAVQHAEQVTHEKGSTRIEEV